MEQEGRTEAAPNIPEGLTFTEVAVRDPLTAVTRKERLYLLAVSMIGVAMVRTGLVPTKVATFGIELDQPNRSSLLLLLALVTVYFLIAFIIYAAADFVARREALKAARRRRRLLHEYGHRVPDDEPMYISPRMEVVAILGPRMVAWLRLTFEFLLPVCVGVYAIYTLLSQSFSLS